MTILSRWLKPLALGSQLSLLCLSQTQPLYIGTYTNTTTGSRGIYSSEFTSRSGQFGPLVVAAETKNPSFLARHLSRPFLYAANETQDGTVSTFEIDAKGGLKFLRSSSTGGSGPCYLAVDSSGKWLFVANYGGGSFAVLPILPDGTTGDPRVVHHSGSGPSPRQNAPHPHQVVEMPDGTLLVPDLGTDRVMRYQFDTTTGKVNPANPPDLRLPPGTGPRHLVASRDGKFVYVIGELANNVTVFAQSSPKADWAAIQTIGTVTPEFANRNTAAEIAIHPDGHFLYTSNRGENDIVVFSIESKSGKLTKVDAAGTNAGPRFFTVDNSGRWLFCAGETSGTVNVFAIDPRTGKLRLKPNPLSVPSPTFVGALAPQ
jgi:6-phosphogluconolactonase